MEGEDAALSQGGGAVWEKPAWWQAGEAVFHWFMEETDARFKEKAREGVVI